MRIVPNAAKSAHRSADTVTVYEYDLGDPDLGGATAAIRGRYPLHGYAVNRKVKQVAYVLSGAGSLVTPTGDKPLSTGDMILLGAGEAFAWDGTMDLFLANSPRFDPQQYEIVEGAITGEL